MFIKKNSLGTREMTLAKAAAVLPATDSKVPGEVSSTGSRSTQRKRQSGKVRSKSKIPVQFSSIRVNRLSGPFETANVMAVEGLRRMTTDRLVTGSIPRNPGAAVIVFPIWECKSHKITTAPVMYRASSTKDNNFTNSQFDAIPNFGFVSPGTRVLEDANEATENIMGEYHETRLLIAHIGMALPSHIIASVTSVRKQFGETALN